MLVRTAGEIRGKSIVWTARVFTGAPKIVEKSRKQFRSPFLVPLAPPRFGSAPPSSSFGAHHLSCAPTTPPCHYTSGNRPA